MIVFNAHHDMVEFTLPELRGACRWAREIDTNIAEPDEATALFSAGDTYAVTGRSLLLFARQEG